MPNDEIEEEVAGVGDAAEKVEMDRLADGEFEVTLRYTRREDPDSGQEAQPVLCRRKFESRSAAETRYSDLVAWIHSLAAPH